MTSAKRVCDKSGRCVETIIAMAISSNIYKWSQTNDCYTIQCLRPKVPLTFSNFIRFIFAKTNKANMDNYPQVISILLPNIPNGTILSALFNQKTIFSYFMVHILYMSK